MHVYSWGWSQPSGYLCITKHDRTREGTTTRMLKGITKEILDDMLYRYYSEDLYNLTDEEVELIRINWVLSRI
jgi:hypothetical protein